VEILLLKKSVKNILSSFYSCDLETDCDTVNNIQWTESDCLLKLEESDKITHYRAVCLKW
jgi:hypothetical protein